MGYDNKSLLKKSADADHSSNLVLQSANQIRPDNSYYLSKAYTNKPSPETLLKKSRWGIIIVASLIALSASYFVKKHSNHQAALQSITLGVQDEDLATTDLARQSLQKGETPKVLEKAAPEIKQKILNGKMSFYKFKIFDSADEDYDIVEVFIDGLSLGYVDMNNAGTTISLPLMSDQQQNITIKGVRDGGGGITFGAETSTGKIHLKVLDVGETDSFTAKVK